MDEERCRILILDTDELALISLEHALEDAGFDTCTTWDAVEARQHLEKQQFDLLIVSDHPPELSAARILREFQASKRCGGCLVLKPDPGDSDAEQLRNLGAIDVIAKRDQFSLLQQARKHSHFPVLEATISGPQPSAEVGRECSPHAGGAGHLAKTA